LQRTDRDARHATRRTTDRADRTLDRHGRIVVDAGASGSAGARAGIDAARAADRAGSTTRGIGDQVSDSAHAAIDSADRTAGSVGHAARRTATGSSLGAETRVRAKADGHGH
jgi:hypothetical protein